MKKNIQIFIGSDHGGFRLKSRIKEYLGDLHINYFDLGNTKLDPKDNYPIFAFKVARHTVKYKAMGILICRTGVGISIAANKVKGARAVLAFSPIIASKSRQHENTNILCLAEDYLTFNQAKKIINIWLKTKFSTAIRHHRRVAQLKKIIIKNA